MQSIFLIEKKSLIRQRFDIILHLYKRGADNLFKTGKTCEAYQKGNLYKRFNIQSICKDYF